MGKLKDLAQRAGRWLGLASGAAGAQATRHTDAVAGDRFDAMAWRDTYAQAPALGELAEELNERFDYTPDLLRDVFAGAYKATPAVRDRAEMDPSRLVNHQVVTSMMDSPEFGELRRETAGDAYAAAMAVLAQGGALRDMLEQAKDAAEQAERAAQAQREAEQAAQAVADALQQATDATEAAEQDAAQAGDGGQDDQDGDQGTGSGEVPAEAEAAVQAAIAHAEQAEQDAAQAAQNAAQALAAVSPGIRAAARRAAAQATEQAREEAALMAAWGIEPGQLERMSFAERAELANRLRSGRLGAFAELVGRFRQMARGERARRVEHAPGELVGVTLGDDLSQLVPSEVAQLGVPELRPVFAAKFADGRLMQYDSRGEVETGQGAIIAAVDCSGSMAVPGRDGITGEAWAKACALALLDQARQSKRDFVGILFSSKDQVHTVRFPAGGAYNIADVIEFAEHFFDGGTNFEAPLSTAVDLLDAEYNDAGRQRGDIVLVTDGECGVHEEWMRAWNEARDRLGFRTFGVAINPTPRAIEAGGVLDALCDNLRGVEDLTEPDATADLFRVI